MCKLLAFSNMEQAFYRKYRPQNLDEMVGQDEAVALISSQISDDKIGHAYLFSGPKGVGKTSLARIIAKELGCDPIFDVSEIDAASHNKVDDIRDMNESVNFIATSPGKKRIFILDEVHMLSNAASNAFLKTLEEPPEHVIFILATTEPDRVIETIRSRTTQVVFKKILDEKIINVLEQISKEEKINFKKDILQIIASYSDGSLRDAINLLEQANNTFGSNLTVENIFSLVGKLGSSELDQIIESIEFQDTSKVLSVIRDAYSKGLQPSDITNSVSEFFRNLFYLKYLPDDEKLKSLSENFSKNLEKANEKISAKQLVRILDLIDEINSTLPVSNSQHLKLELFMMKLVKPEFGSDVKSIGYRLDLLEGQSNLSHPTTDDESNLNNSWEVLSPSGKTELIVPNYDGENIRITQTNELGIYEVYNNGELFTSFPTRLHYNEYPRPFIGENHFNQKFSNEMLRWINLDSDFKKVFSETRHGKSLWKFFLLAAIVFLLIETILSAPKAKSLKEKN